MTLLIAALLSLFSAKVVQWERQPVAQVMERYPELWGGVAGTDLRLYTKTTLPLSLHTAGYLTPAVKAPPKQALTHVLLVLCFDHGLVPEPNASWTLQDDHGCARLSTGLGDINRGAGINPRDMLSVRGDTLGTHKVTLTVSSRERLDIDWFYIAVGAP